MTAAATVEKPVTTGHKPHRLRHVYCRCDRYAPARVAFCGHITGPGMGVAYDPRHVDPDLCTVCIDLQSKGCKRCSK